jgi:photosystem II stability/assembly factor-like uncharacterized protein
MHKVIYLFTLCLSSAFPISLHAQWTKANGLPGGRVNYFLNYGDTALTQVGDILYFSDNEGQSWLPVLSPLQGSLSPSVTDGKTIIGSEYDPSSQQYTSYRTDDFFQTFHPITLLDTVEVSNFFLKDGYIYCSDNRNLYRTNNDGSNWEKIPVPFHYLPLMVDEQRLTMVNLSFISQSMDGGFTWDTLLQFQGNVIQTLQHDSQIYLFMQNPANGCYFSGDYGQTWQNFVGTGFDQVYGFEWHKGSVYGFDAKNLIKTSDSGQTWTEILFPPSYYSPAFCGISTGNTLLIGGLPSVESAALYRSTDDAISWQAANSGIEASAGYLHSMEGSLYAPSVSGLFQLGINGLNWTELNLNFSPPTFYPPSFYDFAISNNHWLLSDRGKPWVSSDNGNSWETSFVSNNYNISSYTLLGDKVIGKANSFTPGNVYLISDDHGLSFHPIYALQTQFQTNVVAIDVDQGTAFALGQDKKIYHSIDQGDTWILHSSPDIIDSLGLIGPWGGIEIFVRRSVIIVYSMYGFSMIVSRDAGQTWEFISSPLDGYPWGIRPMFDLLYIGNTLIAATENGFYSSQNDGIDWNEWNDGFPYDYAFDLEIHDGFIWGATHYAGIWKRPLTEVGLDELTQSAFSGQPIVFSPNPANQSVHVSTSGEAGKLSFYDANGRIVLLQDVGYSGNEISVQRLPQGLYQVIFVGEKTTQQGSLVVQR